LLLNFFNVKITSVNVPLRVVFMGTPQFAVLPLEYLCLNGYHMAAVYTQPDKTAGRGRAVTASPVKQTADKHNIPVEQPPNFKEESTVAKLAGYKPDVIVVAAFGQLLPQRVLDIPGHGCVNIHPSMLPKYRGPSPVAAAILAGEEFTGVSVMLMDKGLDTGPVLAQAQAPVRPEDTTGTLGEKLSLIGAQLLLEALPHWIDGEILPRAQDNSKAGYSKTLAKQDGEIDWSKPAVEIWRRVRAFQPWPGCFTRWQGKQLKIIESKPAAEAQSGKPGQVMAFENTEMPLGILTGEGILGIARLQLEGKKVMTAAEFLRGQRQFTGVVLPD
jgi:methionyl-tRNA formyltransferase